MTIKSSRFRWSGTATVLLAAWVGSAVAASAQDIPIEPGMAPPFDVVALAPDGMETGLEALPGIVADIMARSGVPGVAVAVVHGGDTVFARGFGVRELGKEDPIDADTVFQIASVSKPLSGSVAAVQVSAGVVDWNDKAARYLPFLRLSDDYVTAHASIGDFYSHRSGLPMAAGDELEDLGFDRREIIERLRLVSLDDFRTSYNYSNFGITIGAEAVAAASKMAWEDLADGALFEPLGMTSTSFRHADFLSRSNRAKLHTLENGTFAPLFERDPDAQAPAGGASSSVNDLAKWLKLLLAGGMNGDEVLIEPQALAVMLGAQSVRSPAADQSARAAFYGYGFNVGVQANGRPSMGHSGAFVLGAGANMTMIPSADMAIVVLSNGGPVGAAEAIASMFTDYVQYGRLTRDWFAGIHPQLVAFYDPVGDLAGTTPPAAPKPARPVDDYSGLYESGYFGSARVEKTEAGLTLVLGAAAVELPMTHWDGDTFFIAPRSENAPYGSRSSVTFVTTGDAVTSFSVDYLNGTGLAHWERNSEGVAIEN